MLCSLQQAPRYGFGNNALRWLTSELHCEQWTHSNYLFGHWLMAFLFYKENSSGTCLPHRSLEDALISESTFLPEKRHALPRSDCLDEESLWLKGTLPTGHIWASSAFPIRISEGHGSSRSRIKWPVNYYFFSSHTSHQYEPRSRPLTQGSKFKVCHLDIHRLP